MAVSSTTRKQQFTLDGSTAAFTFTFRALVSNPSDIKCVKTASGTDSNLTYTTDYTVSVNSNGVGGTITLVSPSSVGSGTLTVYRDTTNLQSSDYDDYNQFPADTLETDLDIRTLVSQEQDEAIDRILQLPISYSGTASTVLPTPVANGILGWNAAGSALELKTITPSSSFVLATQSQAETGTENTTYMSPLRVFQAIAAKLLVLAAAVNFAKGADIASATTTDIGAATGNFVHVTGTVTITGLGTVQAGTIRHVRFAGALTLTYNASSLILPGAASITTAANDTAVFVSEGSGNWRCISYQKASGAAVVGGGGGVVGSTKNLAITNGATTSSTLTITADEAVLEDSSNNKYIARSISATLNIAGSVGSANGLDAGSEAANTLYYVWLIYNGTTVSSLCSTSSTSPILPSGYTYKALVGVVGNNNSSNFIAFHQYGSSYFFDQSATLGSGNVGTSWVAIDLTPANMTTVPGFVPTTLSKVAFGAFSGGSANGAMTNDSSITADTTTRSRNKVIDAGAGEHWWEFNILTTDTVYWNSADAGAMAFLHGFKFTALPLA